MAPKKSKPLISKSQFEKLASISELDGTRGSYRFYNKTNHILIKRSDVVSTLDQKQEVCYFWVNNNSVENYGKGKSISARKRRKRRPIISESDTDSDESVHTRRRRKRKSVSSSGDETEAKSVVSYNNMIKNPS